MTYEYIYKFICESTDYDKKQMVEVKLSKSWLESVSLLPMVKVVN